jgi:hypothetical protein
MKTIDSLFQGERKLFDGMRIDKNDYKFKNHPVLNFIMAYDGIFSQNDIVSRIKRNFLQLA